MPHEPEKLHADALAGLAETLRKDRAVAALVPDRVFTDPAAAEGHLRCVVLAEGSRLGPPPGPRAVFVQRNARVEFRAESPDVLALLCDAVCKVLHRPDPGPGYQSATHGDSGKVVEGDGFVSRTDAVHLIVKQPAAKAAAAPPPPAKGTSPAPPAPDRLIVPPAPAPRPKNTTPPNP